MILGFDITNDANDMNKLCSTAKIAMENLGTKSIKVMADKGYSSGEDVDSTAAGVFEAVPLRVLQGDKRNPSENLCFQTDCGAGNRT